jgi:hypothetical protein
VALSTTPDSTSSNASPARPCQARPRHTPGSTRLRVFRSVPGDASVRADLTPPDPPTYRAAVFVIEIDSISVIGPNNA